MNSKNSYHTDGIERREVSQRARDFWAMLDNRDDTGTPDARWRDQDIRDRQHMVVAAPVKVEEYAI